MDEEFSETKRHPQNNMQELLCETFDKNSGVFRKNLSANYHELKSPSFCHLETRRFHRNSHMMNPIWKRAFLPLLSKTSGGMIIVFYIIRIIIWRSSFLVDGSYSRHKGCGLTPLKLEFCWFDGCCPKPKSATSPKSSCSLGFQILVIGSRCTSQILQASTATFLLDEDWWVYINEIHTHTRHRWCETTHSRQARRNKILPKIQVCRFGF